MSGVTTKQRSQRSTASEIATLPWLKREAAFNRISKRNDRQRQRAEEDDDRRPDAQREEDLDRVEPYPRACVEAEIGVMNAVQAPQGGHRVKHHVLQVDREVEGKQSQRPGRPRRKRNPVQHPHAALCGQHGSREHGSPGDDSCGQGVQEDEPEVRRPAKSARLAELPSRARPFPNGHRAEYGEKGTETNPGFHAHGSWLTSMGRPEARHSGKPSTRRRARLPRARSAATAS